MTKLEAAAAVQDVVSMVPIVSNIKKIVQWPTYVFA